ncbi:MAG: hypothetical protein COV37_15925 [Bdellovibrio sp. CG11_big_fil_rev_8_21_14_0_20_39_38]|nr:MAG: hypothetical protein COW78_15765 [Bdellovibrio sp. CG22_combo_CG10-13_8_21_14_all_39_27]PIR33548.1 MAG: hypothetical protein COV37_15925 [Bdellovibrio sp. CG11_big_fil_rev_8_21_14_0_20_39_38]
MKSKSRKNCSTCTKEGLQPTDKCLRKNGNYRKGDVRIQRYQCKKCGRFIPLGQFEERPKNRRKSQIAKLPLSHFAQWEDYYTIKLASFIARLTQNKIYDELELLLGQPKATIASKISRGIAFSSYESCMASLSYLEEMVIPSLGDKLKQSSERLRLSTLKIKIMERCYEDFHGEPPPTLGSLMTPQKEYQQPIFVRTMLFHGVFGELETRIQTDKSGLFQKEVCLLMNENFFKEYFFGE